MNAHWSPSITIGLPILGLVFIGLSVWVYFAIRLAIRCWRGDGDWFMEGNFALTFGGILAALGWLGLVLGAGFGYFPYSAQYHRWVPKAGTVQTVTGLASSGVFGDWVIQYDGNPTRYDCNDTRCSQVHPGDHVVLSCMRSFQWSGLSGWDCNYANDTRVGTP